MRAASAFGLSVSAPRGWEASIYRRDPVGAETTRPVMHVASLALPGRRGDFGSGVVELMGPDDVFMVLLEYEDEGRSSALFSAQGIPREVKPSSFGPNRLHRLIPGQVGMQTFFQDAGRAFSLYIVLGSRDPLGILSCGASKVLRSIRIVPG